MPGQTRQDETAAQEPFPSLPYAPGTASFRRSATLLSVVGRKGGRGRAESMACKTRKMS